MTQKIENTSAFKALPKLSQNLAMRRENRLKIEDAIIQARTIGLELWLANTTFHTSWKGIVREILENQNN